MPRSFYLRLIHLYIKSSHQYYILDEPTEISDAYFDAICQRLHQDYDKLPEDLLWVLDKDELKAGSGFALSNEMYDKWFKTGGAECEALVPPYD